MTTGRHVLFESTGTNLFEGGKDGNGALDFFGHDRNTHQTTRVSVRTGGGAANSQSLTPSIGRDGRYIDFWSFGTILWSTTRTALRTCAWWIGNLWFRQCDGSLWMLEELRGTRKADLQYCAVTDAMRYSSPTQATWWAW